MSDLDFVIKRCVDDIWRDYDEDESGELDKEETRNFVFDTLKEMSDDFQFNIDDFEKCFKEFDADGSGTIEKHEMVIFIKKVAGLV